VHPEGIWDKVALSATGGKEVLFVKRGKGQRGEDTCLLPNAHIWWAPAAGNLEMHPYTETLRDPLWMSEVSNIFEWSLNGNDLSNNYFDI